MRLRVNRLVEHSIQQANYRDNRNRNTNQSLQELNSEQASATAGRDRFHTLDFSEAQKARFEGGLHLHDLGLLSVCYFA